jgi:hypothetical protein
VAGSNDRETAGHCFEHRVGNAFLVAAVREFAGMEKDVGLCIEARKLFLRAPAGKLDVCRQPQLRRGAAQFFVQGSATGQDQTGAWVDGHEFPQSQ